MRTTKTKDKESVWEYSRVPNSVISLKIRLDLASLSIVGPEGSVSCS